MNKVKTVIPVSESKLENINFHGFTLLKQSLITIAIIGVSYDADAALVSPCAGVSLPPSIITNIVGAAVVPVTGVLDGVLGPLLGPLGLNSNLQTTLGSIAAGNPINLNVLDTSGNVVSPAAQCDASADSFTLETPKGISIGGNQITGLGNGVIADAGELNSIAFGNNAVTNAAALNSIAIGPNATVGAQGSNSIALGSSASATVANSVAIGAGSLANVGAQSNYTAFALPTAQTSAGEVSVGAAGNERKITNVAAGSTATDAVNLSQLQAVSDNAVKYDLPDPLNLRMSVTLEGPTSTDGGTTGGTRITNLAKGDVSSVLSTDAVNGSQLFAVDNKVNSLGLTMATSLGGGATYDPATGAVSSPSYSVYGTTQTNVGAAIDALQANAPIQYLDVNGNPTTTVTNTVTLVGATPDPVRLQNVANGVDDTDAVNVGQLNAVNDGLNNLDGLAVKYDDLSLETVTLAGTTSSDGGITGGTLITNLKQGAINLTSTDAINGSQLFSFTNSIGTSVATNLGGGAVYDAATGLISSPSYSVYGTTQANVGAAITALQTQSPIQYLDANGNRTTTVTNDMTLVGSNGGPVGLHNVAAGVDANDAVNVGQLQAVSDTVADLDALAVKYDDANQGVITLGGPISNDAGVTGGTLITNVKQGSIGPNSTDATNGAQMQETRDMITNITGRGIKFFQINSQLGEADASAGTDSMAIGPEAVSSGVASLALGVRSQALEDGAVAIGVDSAATGVDSIAIGNGAVATGSVAVGAGAQAGNDGAAFGDNAIATGPNQGTAIGNAAVVTASRGVALGAGSIASRESMNSTNTRERFTNIAVTSTEGAVSVGDVGAERQITNVAGGTEATDAVNVRQLDAAIAQSSIDINNQLYGLKADLSALRHDSNAGTAAAMALASMPQSVIPGKVMLAAGAANYEGQSAMSIGISNFSENGRWVVNFNGSANTRGKAGAAVGVGFHW